MPVNKNKRWSADADRQLLQLFRDRRLTLREIAQLIGRSETAVSGRLLVLRKRGGEESSLRDVE